MTEPRWLTARMLLAFHAESLSRFGGTSGLRDEGLLLSALERPRNLYHYGEDPGLPALAGALCVALVRNHPFVDGNKRAGLLAAHAFLSLNGLRFEPDEAETVLLIMGLAAGEVSESELAAWIERACLHS